MWHLFGLIVIVLDVALASILVADFVLAYQRAKRTGVITSSTSYAERAKIVCRDSWTWLWSYIQLIGLGAVQGLVWVASALGDPTVSQILHDHFDPRVVGAVLTASVLITMWARSRTLGK